MRTLICAIFIFFSDQSRIGNLPLLDKAPPVPTPALAGNRVNTPSLLPDHVIIHEVPVIKTITVGGNSPPTAIAESYGGGGYGSGGSPDPLITGYSYPPNQFTSGWGGGGTTGGGGISGGGGGVSSQNPGNAGGIGITGPIIQFGYPTNGWGHVIGFPHSGSGGGFVPEPGTYLVAIFAGAYLGFLGLRRNQNRN